MRLPLILLPSIVLPPIAILLAFGLEACSHAPPTDTSAHDRMDNVELRDQVQDLRARIDKLNEAPVLDRIDQELTEANAKIQHAGLELWQERERMNHLRAEQAGLQRQAAAQAAHAHQRKPVPPAPAAGKPDPRGGDEQ